VKIAASPRKAPPPAAATPALRIALLALSALLLIGWFTPEVGDPDFWWHLRTGQYIWENHRLPVPDPFAFTTASAGNAYAGEELTRHFNLTHEWLAQIAQSVIYRATGFPGTAIVRALLLTFFCALAGAIAWRRTNGFYRSVGAALAAAGVAVKFAADRPFLITFVLLAVVVAMLEYRRWLWALPAILLFWANCHGGFFLGWIVLAAYAAADWRNRRLWLVAAVSILISGLNPNGFRIPWILMQYRNSFLQSKLLEWAPMRLWPLFWSTILFYAGLAALLYARRRARPVDWILFVVFAAAAFSAQRNMILLGLVAPVLVVSYFPEIRRPLPALALAAPAVVLAALIWGIVSGRFFQLRAGEWQYPAKAAEFLSQHRVSAPMFNTYEYGGYLLWRLWPQEKVFIDGRALSEKVFLDYGRILYNHDASDGPSGMELLDRYGVEVIVMNCFEYANGEAYLLAPALADPNQHEWKLVYTDPQSLIFMRRPPDGVAPLDSLRVLDHLEAECALHIENKPELPKCARALGQVFSKAGDFTRARRWLGIYLEHPHDPDPVAEGAYRQLLQSGK
jgi:hypothetical protein